MTDRGLAALAERLNRTHLFVGRRDASHPWTEADAAIVLGRRGVFLPDGLGPVMVGMAKEIAALRDALDGLVKAAEGSLVASGGHMDSGWNDVIGATQSWHDCLPNASALRAALAKTKGTP